MPVVHVEYCRDITRLCYTREHDVVTTSKHSQINQSIERVNRSLLQQHDQVCLTLVLAMNLERVPCDYYTRWSTYDYFDQDDVARQQVSIIAQFVDAATQHLPFIDDGDESSNRRRQISICLVLKNLVFSRHTPGFERLFGASAHQSLVNGLVIENCHLMSIPPFLSLRTCTFINNHNAPLCRQRELWIEPFVEHVEIDGFHRNTTLIRFIPLSIADLSRDEPFFPCRIGISVGRGCTPARIDNDLILQRLFATRSIVIAVGKKNSYDEPCVFTNSDGMNEVLEFWNDIV